MIKNYCLIFLFFSLLSPYYSQAQDPNNISVQKVIPPPPTSQEFQKFLGYPISPSTGTTDINIPLYTIDVPGLPIPLSLKYHSSGVKVEQSYGTVGYGWSLFPSCRISRTIMGKPDEFYRTDQIQNSGTADYYADIAVSASGNISGDGTVRDGQFDIFNVSLPNYSGSFIIKREGSSFKAVSLPDAPLQINVLPGEYGTFSGFEVIDDKGIKYLFNDPSVNFAETSNGVLSGWMLKQIILPGVGNIVSFTYKPCGTPQFKPPSQSIIVWDSFVCPFTCWNGEAEAQFNGLMGLSEAYAINGGAVMSSSSYSSNYSFSLALNSIEFATGKVELTYDNLMRLLTIKTSNAAQQIIKTISFTQTSDRLLTKVTDGINEYKMDYNPQKFDDQQDSEGWYPAIYSQDRWGFYNHQKNRSLVPQLSLNIVHNAFGSGAYTLSTYEHQIGGANKEADAEAMKANSLVKITYPTGGWSSFAYEPHKFLYNNQEKIGGGLRITQIDTYDPVLQKTITKTYKYGENENGLGNLLCYPTDDSFIEEQLLYGHISCGSGTVSARRRTISASARYRYYNLNTPVWYSTVTEYTDGGKIHYQYVHQPDGIWFTNHGGTSSHSIDVLQDLNNLAFGEPFLKIKQVFKGVGVNQYALVQKEVNDYSMHNSSYINGQIVEPYKFHAGFNQNIVWSDAYQNNPFYNLGVYNPFDIYNYRILTGKRNLTSTINSQHEGSTILTTTTTNEYDSAYPFSLTCTTTSGSDGGILQEKYYYPTSVSIPGLSSSQQAIVNTLKNNNRLTTVVQKTSYKGSSELSTTRFNYADWGNNILAPESVETRKGSTENFETRLRYQAYDLKGNVRSVSQENGSKAVYLYSYGSQYPVAKIDNADYSTVESVLGGSSQLSNFSANLTPSDSYVRSFLSPLQSHSSLQNSAVTLYTYKPLEGMTSMTDPRGQTTTYEYDNFQRLWVVRDHTGKILKKYDYHYKP